MPCTVRRSGRATVWVLGVFCAALPASAWSAEPPLHARIDELIAAALPDFAKQAAPPAADEEFVRRIYLDLVGRIPAAAEARAFLADRSTDKRARLIDQLLSSPEYARHMATVFDVTLMERRIGRHVPQAQWVEYLRDSFAANKPWDELVREILAADGSDPKTRPAARFFLDREAEPHLITRDIGRLFLGKNLQCAQCHDHPSIDSYKQQYYYGLFAFVNRSFLFTAPGKPAVYAERADGEASYQSVFDPSKTTKTALPRLLDLMAVADPKLEKGKEYQVPPKPGVQPVPTYSRRAALPAQVTHVENVAFRRNIANRLWAHMLGRGLVHPIDMDHENNEPSHPELLDLLADQMAAKKYDIRYLLREIALSQTYQRSSQLPAHFKEPPHPRTYLVANLKPLWPEALAWSMMQATGLIDAERTAQADKATEARLLAVLTPNLAPFIAAFGSLPGTPEGQGFEATLDQALFVANGAQIRSWLKPRPGNLADRLLQTKTTDELIDELFLSVFTRQPSAEEKHEVTAFLKKRDKNRTEAVQDLIWALIAASEFRFNH